ncbi:DNZ54_00345 family protein [Pantoea agglomerans]
MNGCGFLSQHFSNAGDAVPDGERKRVFAWLLKFAQLADRVPLRWYHRVFIAVVMCAAGWKMTAFIGLFAAFYCLMIRTEFERAAA